MSIPKHEEIRFPALSLLATTTTLKYREFELPLAEKMGLSEDEVALEYDSGNGRVFYDRISWALSYMNMAGLVQKPKRGVYAISDRGREFLDRPQEIDAFIAKTVHEQDSLKQATPDALPLNLGEATPLEELEASAMEIRRAVNREIIDVILSKTPREFEKLVVMLLQAMGYGGEVSDAAMVTPYTNDKGIDGIIKEDVLGLGRIHIQAKRYAIDNTIGREEIQKFVGALAVAQSDKGVFITTSSYSRGAIDYVASLNGSTTVVLIDGDTLAKYIYDFGLGMQVERTIEVKKLDSDFWDALQENPPT
jgi:restriction system protein